VRALSTGANRIRFVLHLDVHPDQVEHAVKALRGVHS
jgi:threonine aldolase